MIFLTPIINPETFPTTTPTVTTTGESSVTTSSAVLGGNVTDDGGATVTERGVVYSQTATNSNPQILGTGVTKESNGSGTGSFSETINFLSSNTGYSFRAYAINSEGTSYGAVDTFTTQSAPSTTAFDMTSDDYGSSGAACLGAGVGDSGQYYHDGSLTYPGAGDTIYTNSGGTITFNGENFWFYVDGNGTAIQIDSSGNVVGSPSICA